MAEARLRHRPLRTGHGAAVGEIANLNRSATSTGEGTVTLKGTKSRRQDILPLPMETGQALADYLQHERPAPKPRAIFVLPRRLA
jgi:site-specific recombinase XerD